MKKAVVSLLLVLLLGCAGLLVGCGKSGEEAAPASTEPPPPPRKMPGDFVTIPAGEFTMGSDERPEKQENMPQYYEPAHKVDLPAYQISIFEVTNGEYIKFQLEGDYKAEGNWRQFYAIGKEDNPVANVTLQDAEEYCKWIGGRLPSEAEWEKAARGPEGYAFPWGNEWKDGASNCNEAGLSNVAEVGSMEGDVSGYGVHDMMGNVTEWTGDKFGPYPDSPKKRDPNYTKGFYTVRGASYAIKGRSFRLWSRGAYLPKSQYGIGFRCVKDAPAAGGQTQ